MICSCFIIHNSDFRFPDDSDFLLGSSRSEVNLLLPGVWKSEAQTEGPVFLIPNSDFSFPQRWWNRGEYRQVCGDRPPRIVVVHHSPLGAARLSVKTGRMACVPTSTEYHPCSSNESRA
jgi:hypothetical protein